MTRKQIEPWIPGMRFVRFTLLLVVPLVAALIGLRMYAEGGREMETENAYVKTNIVTVSAAVTGRVIEVSVDDDSAVKKGDVLFLLDPTPYEITAARARAQMDVVRTEMDSLRAGYRTTLVEAAEAKERIEYLAKQVERQERLKERGMSRADQYDEAKHNLEASKRRLQTIQEHSKRVQASLGGNLNAPAEEHPRYLEAKAAYDAAMFELARTHVKALNDGVVSNMKLQVGEWVNRGAPVFSLIESGPPWVEANYKETQLTNMREGQPAWVVADAYPDVEWVGKVEAIAPASGAEFAVLPPQNATGNWVKVVQRIPVRVTVHQSPGQPPLRAGMTVTVRVDTGHNRGLPKRIQALIDKGYLPQFLEPTSAMARNER
ncbi:MAG: HlyD family secretion protein [Betaproteobacteria bacterium]|nr:HlyD family secretion protein [Betaproteobacteria bacterium]